MSQKDAQFLCINADCLSTSKLCALDEYWSKNSSHPMHLQIHEIIQNLIIRRGEKTLKQKKLILLRNLERSYVVSNPMGRFSANIISLITKFMISQKNLFNQLDTQNES